MDFKDFNDFTYFMIFINQQRYIKTYFIYTNKEALYLCI